MTSPERCVYVATGTYERFRTYCEEAGLDPTTTIYVNSFEKLLGRRGGLLIVLPDFMDPDWPDIATYAQMKQIEVLVR